MIVQNNRGYIPADQNFDETLSVDYIPLDSSHSPVQKVNYRVEPARVGKRIDYESLTLEIWTTGAIRPTEALSQAAKILRDHLVIFLNVVDEPLEKEPVAAKKEIPYLTQIDILSKSIEHLELSVRVQQLPALGRDREDLRARPEDRGRAPQDQELRPQVAGRDQGDPGQPRPRTEPRPPPQAGREDPGGDQGSARGEGVGRMRHQVQKRYLRRTTAHRRALLRNLVTSFIDKERVTTTVAKAKEARPLAEKMITLAKRNTLHARRQALAYITKEAVVKKLFETIGPRFTERPGGYTRIVKLAPRAGDGAEMAVLELVGSEFKKKDKKKKDKDKEAKAKKTPLKKAKA